MHRKKEQRAACCRSREGPCGVRGVRGDRLVSLGVRVLRGRQGEWSLGAQRRVRVQVPELCRSRPCTAFMPHRGLGGQRTEQRLSHVVQGHAVPRTPPPPHLRDWGTKSCCEQGAGPQPWGRLTARPPGPGGCRPRPGTKPALATASSKLISQCAPAASWPRRHTRGQKQHQGLHLSPPRPPPSWGMAGPSACGPGTEPQDPCPREAAWA